MPPSSSRGERFKAILLLLLLLFLLQRWKGHDSVSSPFWGNMATAYWRISHPTRHTVVRKDNCSTHDRLMILAPLVTVVHNISMMPMCYKVRPIPDMVWSGSICKDENVWENVLRKTNKQKKMWWSLKLSALLWCASASLCAREMKKKCCCRCLMLWDNCARIKWEELVGTLN